MQSSSYIRGKGFYYKFDVRAKLILTILLSIASFFTMPLYLQYTLTLLALLLSFISVKVKATFHSLFLIMPMIIFMVLFMPFQQRGGESLITIKNFTLITKEGFLSFQFFTLRFVFISLLFSLLLQTTKERDILPAFRFFRLPYSASLVLSLAMRFIPEIGAVFNQIRESQRLRLPNPDDVAIKKKRLRSLLPVLISTLVVVLKDIPYSAAALEMRGYGRGNKRSDFHSLKSGSSITIQLIFSILLPLLFVILLQFL